VDELTIISHDRGCRYAREANGGHSAAAHRLAERYALHKLCGERHGWIAVRFADGGADDLAVFPTRSEAVDHSHHNEAHHCYVELTAPSMTVCEAASVLRMQAMSRKLAPAQRGTDGGGLVLVPRLGLEDVARQLRALTGRGSLPVALGKRE